MTRLSCAAIIPAVLDPFREDVKNFAGAQVGLDGDELDALVGRPSDPSFGDYALVCHRVAKKAGRKANELAAAVAGAFAPTPRIVSADAAGPYVNFRADDVALARHVIGRILEEGRTFGRSRDGEGRTVVIEFSSPNIAKPFAIGHLRSTCIGWSLSKLLEAQGCHVVRLNHPGDWGTQFGLLLAAFEDEGDEGALKAEGVRYLHRLYVRANERADADEAYRDRAKAAFKALEDGDGGARRLWSRFREISMDEFQRIYDLLRVRFDSLDGEAACEPEIPKVLELLEQTKLLETSEGALVVRLKGEMPPAMLLKSDGATTYLARDLAAAVLRAERYAFDRCIYVVGADQKLHFRQLFGVVDRMAEAAKAADAPGRLRRLVERVGEDWPRRLVHVDFGLIRFGGKKMRSRKGTAVLLERVLQEAMERARDVVRESAPELQEEEIAELSRPVGLGAVIFFDLSKKRGKDADFRLDEVVRLLGDTGPYVHYTHARLCGILRKAGERDYSGAKPELLSADEERRLVRMLFRFPDAGARAAENYEPSAVALYLLHLCSDVNSFYNNCRVLGEANQIELARLALVRCARTVLASGLELLGMEAPERM